MIPFLWCVRVPRVSHGFWLLNIKFLNVIEQIVWMYHMISTTINQLMILTLLSEWWHWQTQWKINDIYLISSNVKTIYPNIILRATLVYCSIQWNRKSVISCCTIFFHLCDKSAFFPTFVNWLITDSFTIPHKRVTSLFCRVKLTLCYQSACCELLHLLQIRMIIL